MSPLVLSLGVDGKEEGVGFFWFFFCYSGIFPLLLEGIGGVFVRMEKHRQEHQMCHFSHPKS